jgi:hypothetical protein
MKNALNLNIYDSNSAMKHRRNKKRLLFLFVLSALGLAIYFTVPKIASLKSTNAVVKPEPTVKEQIIKTIELPDIDSMRNTAH